jgi:hypothetical protein
MPAKYVLAGIFAAITLSATVVLVLLQNTGVGPSRSPVSHTVSASTQSSLAVPTPSLPPHHNVELFGKLILPYLDDVWEGAMSDPDSNENIVDRTNCSDITANCPHINIINLNASYIKSTYGNNPVKKMIAEICRSSQAAVTSVKAGGELAQYTLCSSGSGYVWYVPSKGILVTAYNNASGKIGLEGLLAALANVSWK